MKAHQDGRISCFLQFLQLEKQLPTWHYSALLEGSTLDDIWGESFQRETSRKREVSTRRRPAAENYKSYIVGSQTERGNEVV